MPKKIKLAMSKPLKIAANKAMARVIALSVIVRLLSIIINDAFNDVSIYKKKVIRRRRISVYETITQEIAQ